jgi:hypothetical protein
VRSRRAPQCIRDTVSELADDDLEQPGDQSHVLPPGKRSDRITRAPSNVWGEHDVTEVTDGAGLVSAGHSGLQERSLSAVKKVSVGL